MPNRLSCQCQIHSWTLDSSHIHNHTHHHQPDVRPRQEPMRIIHEAVGMPWRTCMPDTPRASTTTTIMPLSLASCFTSRLMPRCTWLMTASAQASRGGGLGLLSTAAGLSTSMGWLLASAPCQCTCNTTVCFRSMHQHCVSTCYLVCRGARTLQHGSQTDVNADFT